jgi:polyferredoxin
MLGKKIFGRNLVVPRWLDFPLRSLKYILLLFFVVSIGEMGVNDLQAFIYSPYNKVADIKMYLFFAEISGVALATLMALMLLSIPIRNFWCRYLCPYGALLGAISWLSPPKITRNKTSCIDCELCTRACPSDIPVHRVNRVWSDECMSCLACVEVCPVKNTLDMRALRRSKPVPNWFFGVMVGVLFMAITGAAIVLGHWQNGISKDEYLWRFQKLDSPLYQHMRGEVPEYGPND